ncbi:MAG TPA: helix-turn-helix domain-containing protein [Dehalococcoidia bacterium]|nr:helix-turn-helix domain-containing protein [Dehalococcoidia bacterium]
MEKDERLTLDVPEAARLLGLSRDAAYQAIERGEIPHLRIGRRILVPRFALSRMIEQAGGLPLVETAALR